MFTGRVVKGAEIVSLGIANYCVADDELTERTIELAVEILKNSWHTLRADKSLVFEGQQRHLEAGLDYERTNSPGRGPDMEERLKSFGNKTAS